MGGDAVIGGLHDFPNAVAQMPRGFHAAIEHPLKLARGDTFLRSAKQVDGLKPHPQWKVAVLKNRALAHSKGRATAGVTLAQADLHDAFGVFLARLGPHALKPADLLGSRTAMRTGWPFGPKLRLNVLKGGFFTEKTRIGKDGVGHGYLQWLPPYT